MFPHPNSSAAGAPGHVKPAAIGLSSLERAAILIAIIEIPLQIDKYFAYHEQDAMLGAVGGLGISITTFSLIFLYTLWLAEASSRSRRTMLRPLFGIPMLVYLAINLLSAVAATKPMLSFFDFVLLSQAYLLFFFLANRVRTRDDLVFCILALAVTIVVQGMFMFYAATIGMDNESRFIGPLLIKVGEGKRHAGSMHAPNLAGSTLGLIWLPVAAALLFMRGRRAWWFVLLASSMAFLGILMTQSRGAILTTFVGGLIVIAGLLARGWLPRWTAAIAALFCVIGVYPLAYFYQNRIQADDRGSAASRMHLSLIALEAISERPIVGHGAGNCHLACRKFADQAKYRAEWFYTVHCKYLLVWVETGILGLLAFLAILGSGFRQAVAVWRTRDPALSVLGLAFAAALAGHVLHMSVDLFNSRTQVQILWCMLGLIAATYKNLHPCEFQRRLPAWSRFASTPPRYVSTRKPFRPAGASYGSPDRMPSMDATQ